MFCRETFFFHLLKSKLMHSLKKSIHIKINPFFPSPPPRPNIISINTLKDKYHKELVFATNSNPYIFTTCWCKLLEFQTLIIWSNILYSLKYLRSTTLGCKDIRIKTQFLYVNNSFFIEYELILA